MEGYLLPLTLDPWQVMTLDVVIDGEEFHAQVEIRYLPAPDQWVVSIWNHSSSELLVNMIPLVCSYGEVNDLLAPFRFLRNGKGLGSLICLRGTDEPSTTDPVGNNLNEFQLLWGDSL
ncbi:MAG: hypothetical protein IKG23_01440 [Clostridia bacterium]|nr:hypothetical protein [Clostridia bacterium]